MNAAKQPFPVSAAICVMMAALFTVRRAVAPLPVEAPYGDGMPLAAAMTRLSADVPWVAGAIAAIVAVWTLAVMFQITVRFAPGANRNYLPAQLLLVAVGGVAVSGEALASLIAVWLMTLATRGFSFSFRKGYRFSDVFHAAFFLGCIPLLYAPAAVMALPVAAAAVVVYRRSLREAAVCLVGLALPVPVAGFAYWAAGAGDGYIFRELWRCATSPRPDLWPVPWVGVAVWALVAVLAAVSVLHGHAHRKGFRNTPYRFMQATALTLLFVAGSSAVPGSSVTVAALAAVPCAALVPFAFHGKSAHLATALYVAIVAGVLLLDLPPVLSALPGR